MFGLGFWELVMVVVVAIVLIPPKQYGMYLRKSGKLYKQLQTLKTRLLREINLSSENDDELRK